MRRFEGPWRMRDGLIDPEFITGPHITPQSRSAGSVDQTHDGLAINAAEIA